MSLLKKWDINTIEKEREQRHENLERFHNFYRNWEREYLTKHKPSEFVLVFDGACPCMPDGTKIPHASELTEEWVENHFYSSYDRQKYKINKIEMPKDDTQVLSVHFRRRKEQHE